MTITLGIYDALDYTDWYEFYKPNPCEEAEIDYFNNRIGAMIALKNKDCEEGCKENNNLRIIKEEGECN